MGIFPEQHQLIKKSDSCKASWLRLTARISLLLLCCPVMAQTTTHEAPGVSNASLIQTLLGLLFIIALLFVLVYFLRRFSNLKTFGNKGPLRIAGGLMIGPRERILLVEIEETWLVVGVVPGQIKTLYTLPRGEIPPIGTSEAAFGKWLKQISERNHEKK